MKPTDHRAARLRIALTYLWRHRRLPNLDNPALFTELVQWRKLRDRNPLMPEMADKLAVKSIVSARLGRDWVIPVLWSGNDLPRQPPWKSSVVVKARHGCNQNAFVRNHLRHWRDARAVSARWMRRDYGGWLDEWLYAHIPRGLLVEPFVGVGAELPIDYKIFVFGGQATHVQVHLDRARDHRWVVHDRDWRAIANDAPIVARPTALPAMIAAAEEMAHGFDFARVDFYQPGPQPLFGEISFYPGSGLSPMDPPELDAEMGRLWLRAAGSQWVAAASAHRRCEGTSLSDHQVAPEIAGPAKAGSMRSDGSGCAGMAPAFAEGPTTSVMGRLLNPSTTRALFRGTKRDPN